MIVTTTHAFTSQDIADMFVGMIEGNDMTRAWCNGIYPCNPIDNLPEKNHVWYDQKQYFENPLWVVKVHYDDPNGEEGNGEAAQLIDETAFRAGLQKMADTYSTSHFHDLIEDDGCGADAITYDVLLQLIIFGDVIYG